MVAWTGVVEGEVRRFLRESSHCWVIEDGIGCGRLCSSLILVLWLAVMSKSVLMSRRLIGPLSHVLLCRVALRLIQELGLVSL